MPHRPEAVLEKLKKREFAPVYFLQGDEPYYIDLISDFIEQHALPEHEKGFNQIVCYGKDVNVGTIVTQARRFPMMAERQVVIVKEAQEVSDLQREEGQKLLESYVQNPVPSTILVLAHKHKTLDGRKGLAKTLDKNAVLVDAKKMYDNKLPDWVIFYVKDKEYRIQPPAAQLLADYIGNDLSRLSNEIDKLILNIPAKSEITPDHIQKYVGISKEYNVFELQTALIQRNVLRANQIIHYFESNPKSNPAIMVVATLFGFFSKVLLAHASADRSEAGIAAAVGVNPYFAKDYLTAIRNYPLRKAMHIIHYLREADLQCKGVEAGQISDGDILRELVFKILH
ncbi:DNA polymerase III subunit delta [Xanthocytophaga agilis]|uniref:DNA polymerase III subunit delta n=1 Tax=Xanthocytophaga agilis TaxID=3048010 RepID=A0AAE3R583_9BACT|nr:DNA polymerase III subunit delta [Xanthocytophaga agilis]MDJ1501664.1 DNA polymerase III subunit delta [Xanthocytophaga agilis]